MMQRHIIIWIFYCYAKLYIYFFNLVSEHFFTNHALSASLKAAQECEVVQQNLMQLVKGCPSSNLFGEDGLNDQASLAETKSVIISPCACTFMLDMPTINFNGLGINLN